MTIDLRDAAIDIIGRSSEEAPRKLRGRREEQRRNDAN
jgi:hypothetical protein